MTEEIKPVRKAYRIQVFDDGWTIYSGETAGAAKYSCLLNLRDAYPDATFAWIKSCKRAPEYDTLTEKYPGCVAWKDGQENWQQDKGHWWGGVR